MAKTDRVFEIAVKLTTEDQARVSKFSLPLDLAIREGQLTGDATAGIAELVRNLTGGMNERGGQMSMLRQLLAQHEAEAARDDEQEAAD